MTSHHISTPQPPKGGAPCGIATPPLGGWGVGRVVGIGGALLFFLLVGCIRERTGDCEPTSTYGFTVKALSPEGTELTTADVGDVMLYVFDSNLLFLYNTQAHIGRAVQVEAPGNGDIHIVAWGNLGGGLQNCPQPAVGDHRDNCAVELLPGDDRTRVESYCLSPGDIFHGQITLAPNSADNGQSEQGEGEHIHIYRQVGSVTITIRGLENTTGKDYRVVVRETYSCIDFTGKLKGEKTAYRPGGSFVAGADVDDNYYIPPFYMLPTGKLYIDIYRGPALLVTINSDDEGNPIPVEKGGLTQVIIDLRASVSVECRLNPWGEEEWGKEF